MKILRHPGKNPERAGQSSYITKDELEVREFGPHKAGCPEKLGFVVCGQDSNKEGVPGAILEHLSKKLSIHNKYEISNTETIVETSRGEFKVESEERVYAGPV